MSGPNKRITIKEVARQAGVSQQTVSRVMNNHPDVSEETRQRVQQVVAALNYKPSLVARSLITSRSLTFGVVGTGIDYYGPSRMLMGIEQEANRLGYSLLVSLLHDPEQSDPEPLLNSLLARQVDGIIWAVPEVARLGEWLHERLAPSTIPTVCLITEPDEDLTVLSIDSYQGGRMATEHLIAQGYQHIGLIAGPRNWKVSTQRWLGWRDALLEAGRSAEAAHMAEGDWSAVSGEQALYRLITQYPALDAVFVANDQMSIGALRAAHQLGLRVPEQLGMVGFDDIPEAACLWPSLTTIHQDILHLGALSVQRLHQMTEASAGASLPPIMLQPELIVRESSVRKER